jgi:tetratricopeptide (TPR) repeat protein
VKKNRFLSLAALLLWGVSVSAQMPVNQPYWLTLEQGKRYFRNEAYGDALIAFEDARRERQAMYTRMERALIDLLSLPEVRFLGDSLEQVERYISDRSQANAATALEELYYRVSKASLEGSVTRALEQFGLLKNYPEAEYWIGETYRAEGELGIALGQYQKAYEQRAFLENPGFDAEILYKMVDIHKARQEYTEMERRALEILEGISPGGISPQGSPSGGNPRDPLWSGDSNTFTRDAMTRILENDGIDRFLSLYRYSNSVVERAHRLLGFYYYASGRHNRAAEHLMFAFLIQNTLLIEEIIRGQFDFAYTTLDALMAEILKRPALSAYIDEAEYYKTLYYLGAALYGSTGKSTPAGSLWAFLNRQPQAGEWRGRAQRQLRSPFVEQAREMP